MTEDMTIIAEEAYLAAKEILEKARLEQGELFVVGCSTSEVGGATIGTYSSPELAEMVFGGIYQATQEAGVYLAAQCCEHLNRALIPEKEAAVKYGYLMVNVVPQPRQADLLRRRRIKPSSIRWLWNIFGRQQEWISGIR